MECVSLCEITRDNWLAILGLGVQPTQQRFVADHTPIAAIGLAKAYVRAGGASWEPYAIYAGSTAVGFVELAYTPGSHDDYWIFHFFIDQRFQGQGYGKAALVHLIKLVQERHPDCLTLQLVVHPENRRAQQLYTGAGFRATDEIRWGEPVYQLAIRDLP